MTDAGGDPPAGRGHAWERLREQRAKDLGETDPAAGEPDEDEPGNDEPVDDDEQGK